MKHFAFVLAGPLAIMLAPVAHADEDAYIAKLDQYGVPYRTVDSAVQFGYQICKQISQGTSVSTLMAMTTSDGYYSQYQAGTLIGAAVGGLCPFNSAIVKEQIGGS
jgi:hypothetical protein